MKPQSMRPANLQTQIPVPLQRFARKFAWPVSQLSESKWSLFHHFDAGRKDKMATLPEGYQVTGEIGPCYVIVETPKPAPEEGDQP